MCAHLGQLVVNVHLFKSATVKCVVANVGQILRQSYFAERRTTVKRILVNPCNAVGFDGSQRRTLVKSALGKLFECGRQCDFFKRSTRCEHRAAHTRQTVAQFYLFERSTPRKHVVAKRSYAVGKSNRFQAACAAESVVAD